ncbi:MAG TPA: ribbon-helix-helix domain-containing protein [Dongiaceae bacterium]|nr:ribbon-helix-helix domain-containing protein [Dongiaceae bacterium]
MASNADSTLVNRNVTVAGRRTSLRLEPAMWDALEDVARREGSTVHQICALVDARRRESSLTAAIRVFILGYYRAAATEDGHGNAGHGRVHRESGGASDDRLGRRGITRPYRSAARIS